ncbi:peptidase T [Xenorhabdus szentirmaii]|uniref:Peptidase T n=1 Tax=Xenorhabdus szentirmaii DSM 16338 TaxID=1427518 RepID=W1IWP3_9GAMM|nr:MULTISPECIES: peptidase T [Xenorhabdus]MBD2805109.1 peptidase T [Xenorhabdus sp. ZM]PHM32209.1 peptidase T [Xenorhabdus szentirmaii DSM 16338]CDL82031.1 Peptidase T [Xenorhabdus szentirmaii DSM 16338]
MDRLLDRFFKYIAFDTQSKPSTKTIPSSNGQLKLAKALHEELVQLGFADVILNDQGCVMATLPSNIAWSVPAIGFISHLDTSSDFTGKHVCPQILENYRGGDIALGNGNEVLSPVMFPALHSLLGKTLITTDGKTLLGADDKAGIAEIITAMVRLKQNNIPHGDIRIAFTPDEEIGKGADSFNIETFGAEWAYTVDGGGVGELEFENFNAASATIKIVGNMAHPGMAKGVMVNASSLAMRIHHTLPLEEIPEKTEGYEGFYHLQSIKGTVEYAEMHYLIRDFDREHFENRKKTLIAIAESVGKGLPPDCYIELIIDDNYYNMRSEIAQSPHVVEFARQAMLDCGIKPIIKPIRGGTDGAQLSYRGLPCPNIFTGGYNYHSKYEFISLEGMEQAVNVIMRIAELVASHEHQAIPN